MGGITDEKYNDVYYTDKYDYDPTNYDVDNYTVIQELDSRNKTSYSTLLKMMQMIVKNALKEFKNEFNEKIDEQTEMFKNIAAEMTSDSSDNEDDL